MRGKLLVDQQMREFPLTRKFVIEAALAIPIPNIPTPLKN